MTRFAACNIRPRASTPPCDSTPGAGTFTRVPSRSSGCLALCVVVAVAGNTAVAGPLSIDPTLAEQCFQEAHALAQQDAGRLWGISLSGPMLFVDPETRTVVADRADREGFLKKQGNVFVGTLPDRVLIAGTVQTWAGVRWVMLPWPLPEERPERLHFMAHEMWHRVQDQLGLPASNPANAHLDTSAGRIWLQLEWRARDAALRHAGSERHSAAEDALVFRAYRRRLFPGAAAEERALEMNEGLAEYTGVRLSRDTESAAIALAVKDIQEIAGGDTFVRSFAYASGPAYGILLDEARPDWRKGLQVDDDVGRLLRKALSITLPDDLKAEAHRRAGRYDADRLIVAETAREEARQGRLREYRARLVNRPVLVIPLHQMNIQFDPRNLEPLGELGTVYPTMRISDIWGILTVSGGGALLNPRWTSVQVSAPRDPDLRPLRGIGWTLELEDGWQLRGGKREDDYVLKNVSGHR